MKFNERMRDHGRVMMIEFEGTKSDELLSDLIRDFLKKMIFYDTVMQEPIEEKPVSNDDIVVQEQELDIGDLPSLDDDVQGVL